MTKAELIEKVAEASGHKKKDCEEVLAAITKAVTAALKDGDKVQIAGFGTFEVRERAARLGRNPRTKESVEIPASKSPVFKAGKALKDAVQ